MGQTAELSPICPEGIAELVLIDFGYRTTLLIIEPFGILVQVENTLLPLVAPVEPVLGIAKPSEPENVGPKTVVSLLQNSPKSRPCPASPTV